MSLVSMSQPVHEIAVNVDTSPDHFAGARQAQMVRAVVNPQLSDCINTCQNNHGNSVRCEQTCHEKYSGSSNSLTASRMSVDNGGHVIILNSFDRTRQQQQSEVHMGHDQPLSSAEQFASKLAKVADPRAAVVPRAAYGMTPSVRANVHGVYGAANGFY